MKYIVSEYNTNSNGSMSDTTDWTFDTYEEAERFFKEYDLKYYFNMELCSAGRRKMKDYILVLDLLEEVESDPWDATNVIDSKSITLADVEEEEKEEEEE